VDFTDGDSVLDRTSGLITAQPLTGIARDSQVLTNHSRALRFSDFGFDPAAVTGTVIGAAVVIVCQCWNRIALTQVQLCDHAGHSVNVAVHSTANHHTHAGTFAHYWHCEPQVFDSQFGVTVDFAPVDHTPSNNTLILHSVHMALITDHTV
jgi:hypothetical protein